MSHEEDLPRAPVAIGTVWRVGLSALAFSILLILDSGISVIAGAPGGEFSLEVVGAACSTRPGNSSECSVPAGSAFAVDVYLDELNLPDADAEMNVGYLGFQVHLTNTAELGKVDSPEQREVVWPDCALSAESRAPGTVTIGCATDLGAQPSDFTGLIVQLQYQCGSPGTSGSITLLHGGGLDTLLVDAQILEHAGDSSGSSESLTVNCVAGTPWTPLPPPSPMPRSTLLAALTAEPESNTPVDSTAPTTSGPGSGPTAEPSKAGNDANGDSYVFVWIAVGAIGLLAAAGLIALGLRYVRHTNRS